MANPKLSEALNTILPGEANKRIRQGILLAATAGKSEARTVKAELAQENRLKTGVMAVGTIDFTTTTSADLDLFAWVIDFAIFQPGLVTLSGVEAPNPTFARPDIFTGNALGQITYYAGTVDSEGNAQFPEIPTGEVLLRTVIRQPNGDNDIDDSIPSSSEWVSKSATGTQYLASNLALTPLAGTKPNVLTAGPNGELNRTNPALAGIFSTLQGIGGYSKILTITMDPANQVNYYAIIGFNGISPNFEKGFLWVQFQVDGSGDIINNALKTFGEFDTSLFTLVKTASDTYELYVAHPSVNSFYSFRPEAQFGSSFRYLFHNLEAKVDPLPAGDQYTFSKYTDSPLTANQLAAIQAADSPSALNAFITVSALNSYSYVQEAPINTNYYARRNGVWTAFTPFVVAGTATDGHVVTSVAGVPTWVAPSGGGSSVWTPSSPGAYYLNEIAIGRAITSLYEMLVIKAKRNASSDNLVRIYNYNETVEHLTLNSAGNLKVANPVIVLGPRAIGQAGNASKGLTICAISYGGTNELLNVINGYGNSVFSVGASGIVMVGSLTAPEVAVFGSAGSGLNANKGVTFKAVSYGGDSDVRLVAYDGYSAKIMELLGAGTFGSTKIRAGFPSSNISLNGSTFRGTNPAFGTNPEIFRILNFAHVIQFEMRHDGLLMLPGVLAQTTDPAIPGALWNDSGNVKISA